MATLHITECEGMAIMAKGERAQALQLPAIYTQVVTFTTATLSAAFSPRTKGVRVWASVDCHILVGSHAGIVATTGDLPLTAKAGEVFGVEPGLYLSVVATA